MKKVTKKGYITKYAYAKKHNTTPQNVGNRVAKGYIKTNKDGDIKEDAPYVKLVAGRKCS